MERGEALMKNPRQITAFIATSKAEDPGTRAAAGSVNCDPLLRAGKDGCTLRDSHALSSTCHDSF